MFCKYCGSQVVENSRFCSVCGSEIENGFMQSKPILKQSTKRERSRLIAPKKRNIAKILLMLFVGILVVILALGQMALTLFGKCAKAHVIQCEQEIILNNDISTRNPSRYKLDYEFAVEGKRFTGAVTRVFEGGTHMRETLPIRYLSIWPSVNGEEGWQGNSAGPIMGIVGILIISISVREFSQ